MGGDVEDGGGGLQAKQGLPGGGRAAVDGGVANLGPQKGGDNVQKTQYPDHVMNAYKTPSLHTFTIYGVGSGNRLPRVVRLTNMRHWTDLFAGLLLGVLLLPSGRALGQTAAPARLIGVVTAVDAAAKKITLRTDAGVDSIVTVEDTSSYLRVPPGEKDLKKASAITLADLAMGDRVLARGRNGNGGALTATTVIVMTKGDLAKKQAADRAEWQKRGVAGTVSEVNAEAKEITIKARGAEGPRPLRIQLANGAALRRYAPDSVKFADAVAGTLADIKVGDQVRALGEKSQDGTVLTADELVSGTFRNIAGTVISVDTDGKSVKITDLDTKKPVVVRVNADSNLRRMPPFAAQMIAGRRVRRGYGRRRCSPCGWGRRWRAWRSTCWSTRRSGRRASWNGCWRSWRHGAGRGVRHAADAGAHAGADPCRVEGWRCAHHRIDGGHGFGTGDRDHAAGGCRAYFDRYASREPASHDGRLEPGHEHECRPVMAWVIPVSLKCMWRVYL
jgi:hypothetical protein